MSTVSIIDNKYASLVFHKDTGIVHHCFHKQLNSEHLKLVLDAGIDLLAQNRASKWLSDNREIDPHSDEDAVWVNNDWLPRVIAAGWKYWALVVPNSIKARMNMAEFVNYFYEKGIRIMVFTEIDPAMNWLENVDRR